MHFCPELYVIEAHLRRLRKRAPISAAEEAALRGLVHKTRRSGPDEVLVREGEMLNVSLLLIHGWLGRAKDRQSGRRQITELHVPGDFADLHGFTLKRLDHKIVSLSDCVVATVPHERLECLTTEHPRLARIYWFLTNVDAAVHRQWEFTLGGSSSAARMAHLLCELFVRLEVVGLTRGDTYDFPLTQEELAMCLGLTPVHVNRTLQELRRSGLVDVAARQVRIPDFAALANAAQFDPDYLYLEPMEM
jgi:CRP-like cAMP-binding protein